ncbi:MAG TPA: hypothetical protein VGP62_03665 [Bryobacteraceae bacterium]|jgi:hypothetical protein|nr:hypothetical protein [Bryobacteraceae bacterium]
MTCFRFFLPGLFVLSAFGQSSQNAIDPTRLSKEAVQAILANNLGQTKPGMTAPGVFYLAPLSVNLPKETSCSVPLVEMKVPKDTKFEIAQAAPPAGFRDNMPVAKGLPVCPTDR